MTGNLPVLDVDYPETWPEHVRAEADEWAERNRGQTKATNELQLPDSVFESLTDEHLFLAYHCTRLLPHEIDLVRREGLRLATKETRSIGSPGRTRLGCCRHKNEPCSKGGTPLRMPH
jgi:hypothetical protein